MRFLDTRAILVIIFAASVLAISGRSDFGVRVAVIFIPTIAFVRRITSGDDAYILNDPFVLVPLLALLPVALHKLRIGRSNVPLTLVAWFAVTSVESIIRGTPVAVAGFQLLGQTLPLLVGIQVASGNYASLPAWVLRVLPPLATLIAIYAMIQLISPLPWDLAWLRTQHDLVNSIGLPEAGQFRIFATAESPGALAIFLGPALIVIAGATLPANSSVVGQQRLARSAVIRLCQFGLVLLALALASVRATLFAVPLAILAMVVVDRRTPKLKAFLATGLLGLAVLILPTLFGNASGAEDRYNVTAISSDKSFQERSTLLPQFEQAITATPFGTGVGSTGLSSRLTNTGPSQNDVETIDNGYLARLIETGLPGFVLFAVSVALGLRRAVGAAAKDQLTPIQRTSLGIVILFLLTDLGGPTSASLGGLIFWIALGTLLKPSGRELSGVARSDRIFIFRP